MTSGEWIDLAIGAMYVVIAATMLMGALRARVMGTPLLWVLATLFALRATSRIAAAFDLGGTSFDRVIDVLTLPVLGALLVVVRDLVAAVHARHDALERTQVEYDLVLQSLEDSPGGDDATPRA